MDSIGKEVIYELHNRVRKNVSRCRANLKEIHDLLIGDLVVMIPCAKFNRGLKNILGEIKAFTRYVSCKHLKNKSGRKLT